MSLEPRPAKLTGFASFDHIQVVAPLNVASNGGGYANNHLDIAPALASLVLSFCTLQTLGARSIPREQQIRSAGRACASASARSAPHTSLRPTLTPGQTTWAGR